jgi:hypothetical protein
LIKNFSEKVKAEVAKGNVYKKASWNLEKDKETSYKIRISEHMMMYHGTR